MRSVYLTLAILISLVGIATTDGYGQIALIANKSVPVDSVDASMLSDIYLLVQKKWPDGSRIVLFNLKPNVEIKDRFYNFIGKKSFELRKIWMRLQLTGEAKPPEALKSQDEVLQKVASTEGSIGYVTLDKVTDQVKLIGEIPL